MRCFSCPANATMQVEPHVAGPLPSFSRPGPSPWGEPSAQPAAPSQSALLHDYADALEDLEQFKEDAMDEPVEFGTSLQIKRGRNGYEDAEEIAGVVGQPKRLKSFSKPHINQTEPAQGTPTDASIDRAFAVYGKVEGVMNRRPEQQGERTFARLPSARTTPKIATASQPNPFANQPALLQPQPHQNATTDMDMS